MQSVGGDKTKLPVLKKPRKRGFFSLLILATLGQRQGLPCPLKLELMHTANWRCYQASAWGSTRLRTEQQGPNPTWAMTWLSAGWESTQLAQGPSGWASRPLGMIQGWYVASAQAGSKSDSRVALQTPSKQKPLQGPTFCLWCIIRAASLTKSRQPKYGSSGNFNVLLNHLVSLDYCCFRVSGAGSQWGFCWWGFIDFLLPWSYCSSRSHR